MYVVQKKEDAAKLRLSSKGRYDMMLKMKN